MGFLTQNMYGQRINWLETGGSPNRPLYMHGPDRADFGHPEPYRTDPRSSSSQTELTQDFAQTEKTQGRPWAKPNPPEAWARTKRAKTNPGSNRTEPRRGPDRTDPRRGPERIDPRSSLDQTEQILVSLDQTNLNM